MRIRHKPWAKPELEASGFFIQNPDDIKGKWHEHFARPKQPFHIELGCGKGGFVSQIALKNPDINYLAVDIKNEMLGMGRRKISALYAENNREVDNVLLTAHDIERIDNMIDISDNVSRIYINFCNPWPRGKHHKKRLTHTRQLLKYRELLSDNGEIYFKTDSDDLFNATQRYFKEAGFSVIYLTRDLHNSDYKYNIRTEHEDMFSAEGIKIKFCIAIKDKNKVLGIKENLCE